MRTLLARTAESVYWAGRHLERAEDMARVVLAHGDAHVDLPVGQDVGWAPLLAIAGAEEAFARHRALSGPSQAGPFPEREVVEFLLCDAGNPCSVLASVAAAREAFAVARPALPREVYELCHALWLTLGEERAAVATRDGRGPWARQVLADCKRINGELWGNMQRDAVLAFTRIGQLLERADLTCRVVSVRAPSVVGVGSPDAYDEVRAMAVLRSLAAYQPLRRAMPAQPLFGTVARFLLQDEAFPRAVAACLHEIAACLKDLPRRGDVAAACADVAVRLSGAPVDELDAAGLRELVSELQPMLLAIDGQMAATYFRPSSPTVAQARAPVVASRQDPGRADDEPWRHYFVVHRSTFTYEDVAEESYNEAHLEPRPTANQRCVDHRLDVQPAPVTTAHHVDGFGNAVTTFVVRGPFAALDVTSTSVVAVAPRPVPPSGAPWESVRSVLERDRWSAGRDARRYRAPSRLVHLSPPLTAYTAASFSPGRPFVDALVDLCGRIHADFDYEPGFTSVTTPVLDVFEARRGVCQDFAHLAIACLRSIGLAGRYVSGYVETAAEAPRTLVGADASHAWASAYLPGWGWIDVDPTNDRLVTTEHVTVAWGRDYFDVSPLRGTVEGGGASHTLDVAVEVVRIDPPTGDDAGPPVDGLAAR